MKTKLMALAALKKYSLPFSDENQARYEFGNSSVDSELSRRAAISALETDISKPVDPYGWQVQGLRDTFKGDHAEMDAKAEAARVGGTAYAFPIYTTLQEPAAPELLEALQYAIKQVPELASVPGIESAINKAKRVYHAMLAAAPGGAA